MSNFLIAGGLGFLGHTLVKTLVENGNHVTVVDNEITGSRRYFDIEFEYIKHNICNSMLFIEEQFDFIVNLACPASPIQYQKYPLETLDTCYIGTKNLIQYAMLNSARYLHASTSEIYGCPHVHPQTENYFGNTNCYGPRSVYDEGKRVAETLIYEYQNRGLDARIVRIFNTFGPKMAEDDGRVVSNFITQALKNEPITIYGDGTQTRSFCYVDDTIDGLLTVLSHNYTRPINVGNPIETNLITLANLIIKLTRSRSKIVHLDLPLDDPKQRCPDITKIRQMGWEPTTTLQDGLLKTIDYFRGL